MFTASTVGVVAAATIRSTAQRWPKLAVSTGVPESASHYVEASGGDTTVGNPWPDAVGIHLLK